jgi:hypothetical protein
LDSILAGHDCWNRNLLVAFLFTANPFYETRTSEDALAARSFILYPARRFVSERETVDRVSTCDIARKANLKRRSRRAKAQVKGEETSVTNGWRGLIFKHRARARATPLLNIYIARAASASAAARSAARNANASLEASSSLSSRLGRPRSRLLCLGALPPLFLAGGASVFADLFILANPRTLRFSPTPRGTPRLQYSRLGNLRRYRGLRRWFYRPIKAGPELELRSVSF